LAVLAVISDFVGNSTETTLDLKNPTSTTRKAPTHEPPYYLLKKRERLDAHYRDLRSPRTIGGGLPSRQEVAPFKKAVARSEDDITVFEDRPDEPVVEAVNEDTEGMDVDANVDEVNDAEKNADLDVEEDGISAWQRNKISGQTRLRSNKKTRTKMRITSRRRRAMPGGDLKDQEIELQSIGMKHWIYWRRLS
jgi:hypothetical protein